MNADRNHRVLAWIRGILAILSCTISGGCMLSSRMNGPDDHAIVIAHRGASGYLPEHTLAAYELAMDQGADYIEPDLVITRDGVLVARHENEIGGTTDIAVRPEFAGRRTTKTIDGETVTGWFTEDLTLAELKTLRARERIPQIRSANAAANDRHEVPTLDEILELLERRNAGRAQPIGIYPETKHPSYFLGIGLPLEPPLVASLHAHGYRDTNAPAFIQSFEVGNLQRLREMTRLRLVQLVDDSGAPYDWHVAGTGRTYADMTTPAGLQAIAAYAYGLGAAKNLVIARTSSGTLDTPTSLVGDAHAAGLAVHVWTFRAENAFLPPALRSSDDPAKHGAITKELTAFLATGIDGVFADQPDIAVAAVADARLRRR